MIINKPLVANNIGCIHVVFKIVDSRDAVIKATWMYSRRILRAAWIQPAVRPYSFYFITAAITETSTNNSGRARLASTQARAGE